MSRYGEVSSSLLLGEFLISVLFVCVCLCGWFCWIVGLLDHEDRLCTARGISVGHDVTQKLTPVINIPKKFNPAGRAAVPFYIRHTSCDV
jgi:hypothetical protein